MKVWKFTHWSLNEFAGLLPPEGRAANMLDADGRPLVWKAPVRVAVDNEPYGKNHRPRVDISHLAHGSLVFNEKAKSALGSYLERFGQFLPLDVEGHREWFYHVTNLIDCIDPVASKKKPVTGIIEKEVFVASKVPQTAALFKDPRTAIVFMYANDPAKHELEKLIADAGLTGAAFEKPGSPQRRLRESR